MNDYIPHDNSDEWERCSDIGADMAELDFALEEKADIAQDRAERKMALIGKYIIVCDGKKQPLYLQDRRISNDSYWTKFIENAISFTDKRSAITESKKLRYNKPRVCIVTKNFSLELAS